ncbi:MAG: tRNA guanosine(34) transglycosylase Tgt [Desulfobacca sp.]|nr:tRNA guanosine(34) transglycosylase Tgt [Desulfobacca sp.]
MGLFQQPARFSFQIRSKEDQARTGRIGTPHGIIETPAYIPVATRGSVRSLSGSDLSTLAVQALITNAYHLHLQPGMPIIQQMGGLHRFMGWEKPILIDSGGFQVLSLGIVKEKGGGKISSLLSEPGRRKGLPGSRQEKSQVKVTEDGVEFISYRDGSRHLFTPEQVVNTGRNLGADIIMVLDECTSPFHTFQETRAALERTHRWASRSLSEFQNPSPKGQALFGIIQGGTYQDLREKSARFIARHPFGGFAIGGFLGSSKNEMIEVLKWTIPHLPPEKPRHFLGIGLVEDIFEMVGRGIDLFDCVAPTRMAATGTFLTKGYPRFRLRILNETFKNDPRPIEEDCICLTCRSHSRAYLRHLFQTKEPLAMHLAALHNLHFMESLMATIRQAIQEGTFESLRKTWLLSQE